MVKTRIILILIAFLNLGRLQLIDIDYQPATEAFSKAKQITQKYEAFKQKIAKKYNFFNQLFSSISLEYDKCIEQIKEKKCNNLDQWQSVIEELKLQIQNSQEIEAPFLEYRKNQKVQRLKQLIELGEKQSEELGSVTGKLAEYSEFLKDNAQILGIMYKLPQKSEEEISSFVQQDVISELNAEIPDIAEKDASDTRQKYELGDISIQAQSAQTVMGSNMKHMQGTLATIQEAYNLAKKDQLLEKEKLKESIESLRALIANEQWMQTESQGKIDEFERKIAACKGMPTNIQKDCEPLKLKEKKKNVEIDIINAKTMILFNQLKKLMEENEPEDDIQAYVDSVKAKKEAEFKAVVEESFIKDQKPAISQKAPEELKPIHHLREKMGEQQQ